MSDTLTDGKILRIREVIAAFNEDPSRPFDVVSGQRVYHRARLPILATDCDYEIVSVSGVSGRRLTPTSPDMVSVDLQGRNGEANQGVAATPPGHSDEPASGLAAIAGSVPNAEHTPGPWRHVRGRIEAYTDGAPGIVVRKGVAQIARLGDPWPNSKTWHEREANARLIAAAPELLEVLEEARDCNEWILNQAENAMSVTAGCATTHGDPGSGLEEANRYASDIGINCQMLASKLDAAIAKATGAA